MPSNPANPDFRPTGGLAGRVRGRGSQVNPANRFETISLEVLPEAMEMIEAEAPDGSRVRTMVLPDRSKTIINRIDSPDINFSWTVNPYRGCEHGCVYCYARPSHEYLGYSSGLDFETRILAKFDAPALLERELARPKWTGEPITMSGITDPYQPVERKLEITQRCLEVMNRRDQPVALVTKNRLVTRDIDILAQMAARGLASVSVSVTTLDAQLARTMEPRTSTPRDRLRAIRELRDAGVPVNAMMAPIIPGVNDREIPEVLEAVRDAGATSAAYVLLRLPWQVKDVFVDWLRRELPERAPKVESLIRQARGGKLYDANFGDRMKGEGHYAQQIRTMFYVHARRLGLNARDRRVRSAPKRVAPRERPDPQLGLF